MATAALGGARGASDRNSGAGAASAASTASASSASSPGRPQRFSDVVLAEWTKLRSLRSTFFNLLATVLLVVGLGILIAYEQARHYSFLDGRWDPVAVSLAGLGVGQLTLGALGVIVVTGEYTTGMIRTSLAAVPRRGRLLAAKGLVVLAVTLLVGEAVSFGAFLLGQLVIHGQQPTASLGQPGVARAVAGAGLYLAFVALMGLSLGTLLRHTAGSIVSVVAILFVLPAVLLALPPSWRHPVEEYWPTQAGARVFSVLPSPYELGPWAGFGEFAAFVALVGLAALVMLRRRDA